MLNATRNLSVLQQQKRQRLERSAGAVCLIAIAAAFALALVMFTGPLPLLLGLALLFILAAVLIRPRVGFSALFFCALFLEQWGIAGLDPVTARFPFYQTLSGSMGIPLPVSPVEMLILLTFVSVMLRRITGRETTFSFGPLSGPLLLFLGFVTASTLYGLASTGGAGPFDIRAAWEEIRSFFYLGLTYLLACNLLQTKAHLRTLVWLFVAGIGFKSVQGLVRYADVRINGLQVDAITGHEDVVFFSAFVMLFVGLILFGGKLELTTRRQMKVMLLILPALVFTLLVTNRRLGFVVLAVGLGLVALLLFRTRRDLFMRIVPVVLVAVAIYVPLFWNGTGALSEPIRAVRSIVAPATERDRSSNAWRDLENININYNIRSAPLTGLGFGRPYAFLVPQPPLDATGFTYWRYITHNAIYWVWMKMGLFGFISFWNLIGSAILLGLVTFRRMRDGFIRTLALVAAGVVVMQVIFSYGDLGLTYSRSMIFLGCMVGVLAALTAFEAAAVAQVRQPSAWWRRLTLVAPEPSAARSAE